MDHETEEFYDQYWHRHVPILEETRRYVLGTVTERGLDAALDAGCGHGLCSIALTEVADHVVAVDLSSDSLATARAEARAHGSLDIEFLHQDLQNLDLPDDSYDLVWCWGVAMMAPEPHRVLEHLSRVTRTGGVLYLGIYLKSWLSPVHQLTRRFCRTFLGGPRRKLWVCNFFAGLTRLICWVRGEEINLRPDNQSIQAQVEDWFYPPFKTFFGIDEMTDLLGDLGFEAHCIQTRLGRMKSATIFVVKGVKV